MSVLRTKIYAIPWSLARVSRWAPVASFGTSVSAPQLSSVSSPKWAYCHRCTSSKHCELLGSKTKRHILHFQGLVDASTEASFAWLFPGSWNSPHYDKNVLSFSTDYSQRLRNEIRWNPSYLPIESASGLAIWKVNNKRSALADGRNRLPSPSIAPVEPLVNS